MNDRKRPLETNGDSTSNKKLKSDAVSAVSSSFQGEVAFKHSLTPSYNVLLQNASHASSASSALSSADLIAQKRAEIAAKLASMKNAALGSSASASPTPRPASGTPRSGSSKNSPIPDPEELSRRVADAKRRVANAQSKLSVKDNVYMAAAQQSKPKSRVPEPQPGTGLKMAAHPLLLEPTVIAPQSKKDRYKPMQPKFASIKANTRNAPTPPPPPPVKPVETSNPYAVTPSSKETGFDGTPRERMGRSFRFNPKGKYVALGNQMRQEVQMEALKQRIAESARKAGLDGDMGVEKNLKRPPPPAAEWWDASLLPSKKYDDLSYGMHVLYIRNQNSPITIYIQHPIPIPAPSDKNRIALKPMKLTKKEQKKMRKLKRASELQDKRDRIRMGLLPPDPPKVRLANLMKVLTSDAVQDPTRVEAKVRKEVAQRKHAHDKMNAERKLTDDQRREKIDNKKHEEEKKGIHGAVFKIDKLSDPAHQFKVRRNAEQMALTGVCIFNPNFSLVYVEGAAKYMKSYKRLMLHRIAWTEPARPRGSEKVELEEPEEDEQVAEPGPSMSKQQNEEEEDPAASLEDNKCYLIWEGQVRDRAFNIFRAKSCPTDMTAKELLGDKLKGYWDQAKNWKPEEEEEF